MPYPCCLDEEENFRPFPEVDSSEDAKDLMQRLLVFDPMKRIHTLFGIERVAFFKGFPVASAVNMPVSLPQSKKVS